MYDKNKITIEKTTKNYKISDKKRRLHAASGVFCMC
jgi:hypothetical protein